MTNDLAEISLAEIKIRIVAAIRANDSKAKAALLAEANRRIVGAGCAPVTAAPTDAARRTELLAQRDAILRG